MDSTTVRLFNTFTRQKEELRPLREGLVRIYSCGPTVYRYVHIGNLRTFMLPDLLRRSLEYLGYATEQVMNITDVGHLTDDQFDRGEDKMTRGVNHCGFSVACPGFWFVDLRLQRR